MEQIELYLVDTNAHNPAVSDWHDALEFGQQTSTLFSWQLGIQEVGQSSRHDNVQITTIKPVLLIDTSIDALRLHLQECWSIRVIGQKGFDQVGQCVTESSLFGQLPIAQPFAQQLRIAPANATNQIRNGSNTARLQLSNQPCHVERSIMGVDYLTLQFSENRFDLRQPVIPCILNLNHRIIRPTYSNRGDFAKTLTKSPWFQTSMQHDTLLSAASLYI